MTIQKQILDNIPELKNQPQLVNSFFVFLEEINKIVFKLNDLAGDRKITIDIVIEDKIKQ